MPPSDSDSEEKEDKKKRKRKKRGSSDSESNSSGSSCEDVSESESSESKKAPKIVQMDIPFDKNEIIEELKESEESWKEISDYCIDLAANNLNFI